MENYYIKNNSISVGFNPKNGQEFFDLLLNYYYWIHDWFFSLNYNLKEYSEEDLIKQLSELETYGIPGNLLLNSRYDYSDDWKRLVPILKDKINLKAITFYDISSIKECKETYPDIDIHISVRYFDYEYQDNGTPIMNLLKDIIDKGLYNYIDYINISGAFGFVHQEFSDLCHKYGIKTKFIFSEGCLVNRFKNYIKFPNFCDHSECCFEGYEDISNIKGDKKNGTCSKKCHELLRDYPWTLLCWNNTCKEMISMSDFDIVKVSARNLAIPKITTILNYLTSPDRTINFEGKIIPDDRHSIFLEYCDYKLHHCKYDCMNCMMCKDYYERIFEEEG